MSTPSVSVELLCDAMEEVMGQLCRKFADFPHAHEEPLFAAACLVLPGFRLRKVLVRAEILPGSASTPATSAGAFAAGHRESSSYAIERAGVQFNRSGLAPDDLLAEQARARLRAAADLRAKELGCEFDLDFSYPVAPQWVDPAHLMNSPRIAKRLAFARGAFLAAVQARLLGQATRPAASLTDGRRRL